ncbi:type I secretion C-terminal target domain-containing protein [Tolypothrix sp. PCC 7910]|uniref:right-handed parallel beta-helix repeat-containing protein n=1 Tax=Tolypothrix sp. PCC 7910 TaxID=2099387 RepID=UPI0014279EF4|nr:right-handed parallel beta-helix repeat-containing protein [Tolypothrix sp. PCC 7910]QIR41136.1 type I secretion C-terminal target domain-containing protein [Tolypothrix sp. PCC 7910]
MATINVTSTADNGAGSLRAALASAQTGDTIKFASTLANKTITLTSGQINITKNLTIDGAGAANLKISGNNASRIFEVGRHVNATLRNLSITNGYSTERGGAVKVVDYGSITVDNCKFNYNRGGEGGAINIGYSAKGIVTKSTFDSNDGTLTKSGFSGGAIATRGSGDLTVKDCKFTNNKGVNGGAIYNLLGGLTIDKSEFRNNSSAGGIGGGAICTDGGDPVGPGTPVGGMIAIRNSRFEGNKTKGEGGALFLYSYGADKMLLENCTVIGNTASVDSKGIARGGGLRANNNLTVRNVTFANNISEQQGGAVWLDGGGKKDFINTTFSANKATKDAGAALFVNTDKTAPVNITNSTIVNNFAGRACGAVWIGDPSAAVTLTNSIVANNNAGDASQKQVGYQLKDGGGNIEFPAPQQGRRVVSGSRVVNPLIGPLQNIGGMLVHPLLVGSPAINSGKVGAGIPTIDERGMARDSRVDVGAFEISSQLNATAMNTTMSGPNLMRGTKGGDYLQGVATRNILQGGDGNDTLKGGDSNDILQAGEGDDVLIGGKGKDILHGSGGKDRFVYQNIAEQGDWIQYFETGRDVIDLNKMIEGSNFKSSNPFSSYVKKEQVGSNTVVSVNAGGDTTPNQFQKLLTLSNVSSSNLTAKNFIF